MPLAVGPAMSATAGAPAVLGEEFAVLIARLIADPAGLETRLDAASAALEAEGMRIAAAAMLDFCGDVLQLSLPEGDHAVLRRVLDAHFAPADLLVSDREIGVPRLFVSDMDSTMIGQECIDELADFAGLKDQVAAITERAMQGELDFASALTERLGLLSGLGEDAIATCLADRIRPMEGAQTLVATLKAAGDDLTRANVIKQATSLKDLRLPMLINGTAVNNSPERYTPMTSLQLIRFDGTRWVGFGDLLRN